MSHASITHNRIGPQHTPAIVEQVVVNGETASCGPTRVSAEPLLA